MNLSPQYSASGTNSMLNFFTGALDAAYMGSSPLLLGHTYHLPLNLIAIANAHAGTLAVVARPNALANSAPKLGTVLGSDGHVLAHHFAQSGKSSARPLTINLSPEECLDALRTGMIDFASLWEPWISRAADLGAESVFTDQDLGFAMYSFVVATEDAVREKRQALDSLVAAHIASISEIRTDPRKYAERLRMIFGPTVGVDVYQRLLRDGYTWPEDNFLDEGALPTEVADSLEHVRAAHLALGTVRSAERDIQTLAPNPEAATPEAAVDLEVRLGYSNSIMCTTFHVGDFAGLFDAAGLTVQGGRRRIEERIARLRPEVQEDLRLCYELLPRDPELVVQKLGRMNEQTLRGILRDTVGIEHRSIGAVIENLRELDLLPQDILGWADSIRHIRNVASHHDEALTVDEATNVFNIGLNLVEWFDRHQTELASSGQRCQRCRAEVREEWVACPRCGASLEESCQECGKPLEPEWKICPHCAHQRN